MSDQTMDGQDAGEDVELEATPRKGGMSGKKLVMFIALPLLLLMGAGAGLYMTGVVDDLLGLTGSEAVAAQEKEDSVYYEVPTLLVNLSSSGRGSNFLKLSVSLELASETDLEKVEAVRPHIVDNFQVYLRELRIDDLQGSAGLQRLREELLLRVKASTNDARVRDVLFKEMLVQ